MLIVCPRCGKPVYAPRSRMKLECGYCYSDILSSGACAELKPDTVDWRRPLHEALDSIRDSDDAVRWFILLGDYGDTPGRLEPLRAKDLERLRLAESGIELAGEVWRIRQIIRDLDSVSPLLCGAEAVEKARAAAAEKLDFLRREEDRKALEEAERATARAVTLMQIAACIRSIGELRHVPGADRALAAAEEKKEKLQYEEDLAELEKLKAAVPRAGSSSLVESYIEDLLKLPPLPEREDVLASAYEKRGLLIQLEEAAKARRIRKAKIRRALRWALAAAAVIAAVSSGLYSLHVSQPAKLQKARQAARDGLYPDAEAAYQDLLHRWPVFVNHEVRDSARDELADVWDEWAKELAGQGDWETAIDKYTAAGNADAAADARRAYAAQLEREGRYEEAVAQWELLPRAEEKIRELYAILAGVCLSRNEYEKALSALSRANPETLDSMGISEQLLYLRWGEALAAEGRTDEAVLKLLKAGDSAEVKRQLEILYARQVEEKGGQVLADWEESGRKTDAAWLETLRKTGELFRDPDAMLGYWRLMAEAGIDLTLVYPNGAGIDPLRLPESPAEPRSTDLSRPLVILQREREHTVSILDILKIKADKNTDKSPDPNASDFYLLPESWQRLPAERRPSSLRESTCVYVLRLTYPSAGTYLGAYIMENYVSGLLDRAKGKKSPSPVPTLKAYAAFPLFNARMELLRWNYPGNEMALLRGKTVASRFSGAFPGSMIVDWTLDKTGYGVSATESGLSGTFDRDWIRDALEACYADILNAGGE